MARTRPPVRFSVGLKRIVRSKRPSIAFTTRAVRVQMKVLQKNLDGVIREIENTTPSALDFGVDEIWQESQRLVPRDTERLADSGYVETRKGAMGAEVEVGYGSGGHPFYATLVHELNVPHESPTQWKYLQAAIERHIGNVGERIRDYLRFS